MIYFVQSIDGGPIKIGFTDNLERRLVELEYHYGESLAVLATMPGDKSVERSIHDRFMHLRFDRTEQFRPAFDLMTFIGRPLLVSPNLEAIEAMPVVVGVLVRIGSDALDEARLAALFLDMPLVEYLSAIVREAASRDIEEGHVRWKQERRKN